VTLLYLYYTGVPFPVYACIISKCYQCVNTLCDFILSLA